MQSLLVKLTVVFTIARLSFTLAFELSFSLSQQCSDIRLFTHEGFILLDMFLEKGSKCQLLDSDGFEYTKLNFEYLIG